MVGSPAAFLVAFCVVLVWAASGPLFGFSDTWQLVVNTGTTIVTFLMVFLIQNTQSRTRRTVTAGPLHMKLDELMVYSRGARNEFLDAENLSDEQLDAFEAQFHYLAKTLGRNDAVEDGEPVESRPGQG